MTENPMEFQASDRELEVMVRELDEMHNDLMPRYRRGLAELGDALRGGSSTRRGFLKSGLAGAAAVGGGAVLAACGSGDTGSSSAGTPSGGASSASQDLQIVTLAASLEVLAINTYTTAAAAAGQGSFGAVPPAVPSFITTAIKHHTDHREAWNGVLQQAGQQPVTTPNKKYDAVVQQQLPKLRTLVDVATLAATLELVAAETYTNGAALVMSPLGRQTALSIAPVEYQHWNILQLILGKSQDASAAFVKTDMAAGLDSLNG